MLSTHKTEKEREKRLNYYQFPLYLKLSSTTTYDAINPQKERSRTGSENGLAKADTIILILRED